MNLRRSLGTLSITNVLLMSILRRKFSLEQVTIETDLLFSVTIVLSNVQLKVMFAPLEFVRLKALIKISLESVLVLILIARQISTMI